jgi:hypothetical protein
MAQNRERSLIRASILRKGFAHKPGKSSSDHDYYFFLHDGLKVPIYTKLSRGSKYKIYGAWLLARMASQLKLTNSQVLELIDCPMSRGDYVKVLEQKAIL